MQQVAAGDKPQVRLGRGFEQQLRGGGDARRRVADGPDPQTVEAGLQLGSQHKRGIGFKLTGRRRRDVGRTLVETVVLEPGLQKAGWRRNDAIREMNGEISRQLVSSGFLNAQPALLSPAYWPNGRDGLPNASSRKDRMAAITCGSMGVLAL